MQHMAFNIRVDGEPARNLTVDTRHFTDHSYSDEASLHDEIAHAIIENRGGDLSSALEFDTREVKAARMVGVVAMTLVSRSRAYGGPEEGGWWYDANEPIRVFYVPKARAARMRMLLENWCRNRNPQSPTRDYDRDYFHVCAGVVGRTPRPHYC